MLNPTGRTGEYDTSGASCPKCGHPFESIFTSPGGAPPQIGTVTVCLQCAAPAILNGKDPPRFVAVTPEMLTLIQYTKPDFYRKLQTAQAHVRSVKG